MIQKELLIIDGLRKDARMSISLISRKISVPPSTVYDKINRLKTTGIITRYSALIDFSKLGFNTHSQLLVRVPPESRSLIREFLYSSDCVNSLQEIRGGFDFLLESFHSSLKDYAVFLDVLRNMGVLEIKELPVLSVFKRESFLLSNNIDPDKDTL